MFRMLLAATALVVGVLPAAVQRSAAPPVTWPTYRVADAPADMRAAIRHGDGIIISLHHALLSELDRELERHGSAGAMQACHLDATLAAFRAAREQGIAAGRTSDRLRNPLNAPPAWAAPIVKEYAGRRQTDAGGIAVDLGNRVGLVHPIVHTRTCDPCHGVADKIGTGVRAVLEDRYPQDHAVGFTVGEIRGWYWVEVPKR